MIEKTDNAYAEMLGEGLRASHAGIMEYECRSFTDPKPIAGVLEPHVERVFRKHRHKIDFQKSELLKKRDFNAEHWGIRAIERKLVELRRRFADDLSEAMTGPAPPGRGEQSRLGALDPSRWLKRVS